MKSRAFTLAEVLVTLAVIGVVAVISMGALIKQTKKQNQIAFKNAYQRAYTGAIKIVSDRGNLADIYYFNPGTYIYGIRNEFAKHMNYIKLCNTVEDSGGVSLCDSEFCDYYSSIKDKEGNDKSWACGNGAIRYGVIVLNNGMHFLFSGESGDQSCTGTVASQEDICGRILMDVNGLKGPNKFGDDIYFVWILKEGVIPMRKTEGANDYYSCKPGTEGYGCGAEIMNGNYDY